MSTTTGETATAIRPFHVEFSEERIDDLRRRIAATRWPSKELVDERSQGVQLAAAQALARYWLDEYDFGRVEARLNAAAAVRDSRSTAWTSTSSTSCPRTRTRCR